MHLIFIGLLAVMIGGVYLVTDHKPATTDLPNVQAYQQYPDGKSSTPAEGGANNIRSVR